MRRPRSARALAAGLGLGLLYVAVLVVTTRVSPGPVRPLFDGFAPPEAYRFVNPPRELATGNLAPERSTQDVPLDPTTGSRVSNVSTSDQQAIVSLDRLGTVAPNPPNDSVRLSLEPLDPATLAPLPDNLRPVPNAYRVGFAYQPSGAPVTTLTQPANVALSASAPSDAFLYSPDGRSWTRLESRPYGASHGQYAETSSPGFFVVASSPALSTRGGGGNAVLIAAGLGLVPLVAAFLLLRGRRHRPAAAAQAKDQAKAKGGEKAQPRPQPRPRATPEPKPAGRKPQPKPRPRKR